MKMMQYLVENYGFRFAAWGVAVHLAKINATILQNKTINSRNAVPPPARSQPHSTLKWSKVEIIIKQFRLVPHDRC